MLAASCKVRSVEARGRSPRLFAISDLHVDHPGNWRALVEMPPHPEDGLIIVGDVGDSVAALDRTLAHLAPRWGRLFWAPGNHELWTVRRSRETDRGVRRYERLVETCRRHGVLTPEDPVYEWPGIDTRADDGRRPIAVAPVFVLYDYGFAPAGLSPEQARRWAMEGGIFAADEALLHPEPYESREAWCGARVALTEAKLEAAAQRYDLVIAGHWPFRRDLVKLGPVERYAPWCGTPRTEDWHRRFRAVAMVSGHLHVRGTDERDGVRFEEVSLGYPRDWDASRGIEAYLRRIL